MWASRSGRDGAVYGCVQGPAVGKNGPPDSNRLQRDGADAWSGMTGMHEALLGGGSFENWEYASAWPRGFKIYPRGRGAASSRHRDGDERKLGKKCWGRDHGAGGTPFDGGK